MKGKADINLWDIQRRLVILFYRPHGYLFPREPFTHVKQRERESSILNFLESV